LQCDDIRSINQRMVTLHSRAVDMSLALLFRTWSSTSTPSIRLFSSTFNKRSALPQWRFNSETMLFCCTELLSAKRAAL